MGNLSANSPIAWPDRWPPPIVGRRRLARGGRTEPAATFNRVWWCGSSIQLQVGNDDPRQVGRSARDERVGVANQDQTARQGGVLRPRVVEAHGDRHLAPEDRFHSRPVERRERDSLGQPPPHAVVLCLWGGPGSGL